MRLLRRLARFLADTAILLVAGSLAATLLFRLTPGADSDPSDLAGGLSEHSIEARRAERRKQISSTGQSVQYFVGILRGDFGKSTLSGAPVSGLMLDRAPATLWLVLSGALLGLAAGLLIAGAVILIYPGTLEALSTTGFLGLLSLPAGLLVLLAIFTRLPLELAVGAVVAPRVYFYASRLLAKQRVSGYVLHAIASGVGPLRIAVFHIMPALRSELYALAGFAIVTALAAAIPAEALSGRPGIGQLAWRSAMERDLPVLVAVTLCLILASRAVTLLSAVPPRDSRFAA
jgi:ABC-type dipeptide/oligopeptide/nickel transport system permease component